MNDAFRLARPWLERLRQVPPPPRASPQCVLIPQDRGGDLVEVPLEAYRSIVLKHLSSFPSCALSAVCGFLADIKRGLARYYLLAGLPSPSERWPPGLHIKLKLHKAGAVQALLERRYLEVPTRLIHSYFTHPSFALARALAVALRREYGSMPHVLTDSVRVLERVRAAQPLPPGAALARLDARNMFSNIHLSTVLPAVACAINHPVVIGRLRLTPDEAIELLARRFDGSFGATYAPSGDIHCARMSGLPMGHPLSAFVAAALLSLALALILPFAGVTVLAHFVDDLIAYFLDRAALDGVVAALTRVPGLRWEVDVGNRSLLLGVRVLVLPTGAFRT